MTIKEEVKAAQNAKFGILLKEFWSGLSLQSKEDFWRSLVESIGHDPEGGRIREEYASSDFYRVFDFFNEFFELEKWRRTFHNSQKYKIDTFLGLLTNQLKNLGGGLPNEKPQDTGK